jgi:hypothetical protein
VALWLAAAYGASSTATRPLLEGGVTLGHPSFLEAMVDLRERSRPGDRVLAANCHQVHWYTRLRCGGFRGGVGPGARQRFGQRLADADWVVVTNFERGQPRFVEEELAALRPEDFGTGGARRFRDPLYWTVVVPAEPLRERHEAGAPQRPSREEAGAS